VSRHPDGEAITTKRPSTVSDSERVGERPHALPARVRGARLHAGQGADGEVCAHRQLRLREPGVFPRLADRGTEGGIEGEIGLDTDSGAKLEGCSRYMASLP
jgi:hypothetical protein